MSLRPVRPSLEARRARALALVLLTFASTACALSRPPAPTPELEDQRISAEILRRLVEEDDVDASGIRIETSDAVVILSGVAGSIEEIRRALRIAGRVRGVEQIVNRIRVVPHSILSA